MSDTIQKAELADLVKSMFDHMDAAGATVHPFLINHFYELAKMAGIPEDDVPTEERELRQTYGTPPTDPEVKDVYISPTTGVHVGIPTPDAQHVGTVRPDNRSPLWSMSGKIR